MTRRRWMPIIFALLMIAGRPGPAESAAAADAGADRTVRIGVLAKRGKDHCLNRWGATADYLSRRLSGTPFRIIPLSFEEVEPVVAQKGVDFILANSSFYVTLEQAYGVDRIATLINRHTSGAHTRFAGVIFTRSDRTDITGIEDLKHKRFIAVKETSLGGWQMAWREFKAHGIDPYLDFGAMMFAGTHDGVVYAVHDGRADAGTVRTDTLERMAAEGRIHIDGFRILPHVDAEPDEPPFSHSTRAYPEWPMARVRHTPEPLARQVAVALMQMPADDPAASAARIAGWTIPLNYQPVHDCLRTLEIGPYAARNRISSLQAARALGGWIALTLIVFLGMGGAVGAFVKLNRRLRESNDRLTAEVDRRCVTARALTEAEHFNRSIITSVGEGVIVFDRDLRYRIWNQRMEEITGLSADEVVGKTPTALFPHISQRGVGELLEQALGGEIVTSPDTPYFVPKTKRYGWVVGTYGPHLSSDGEIIGVVAVVRDITSRKITEEALVAANERFQSVMDGMDSLVYVADISTYEILYINKYGQNVWGDVTGKTCWQVLQSDQRGPCAWCSNCLILDELGHPTGIHVWEFQNTVNGRWYECRDQAIQWSDRRFVRLEIATDITDRKAASDQLVAQNQFMNHVLESLTHPFLVINVDDYTIDMANSCAGPVALGETCHRLTHHSDHPCCSADHPCPIDIIRKTGNPTIVEHVHFNRDGEARHVEVHGYPIRDARGRISKIIEYALDITDRKRTEIALQEKEEYLQIIMSTVQTGVLISEWETGRITDANPYASSLIGEDRNAIVGRRMNRYLPDSDPAVLNSDIKEMLMTTARGDTRHVRVSETAVCIRDHSYAVHSFMDVTDMRELIDQQVVNIELAKSLLDLVNGACTGASITDGRIALHLEAISVPCRAAGGDHHFTRTLLRGAEGAATYISVKDQSGHEVNCILRSIYTDLIHNAILSREGRISLEQCIETLNTRLVQSGMFAGDDFLTAVMARIDHRTLDMHYAACGHPPFLLIRGDTVISLPQAGGFGQNLPLGAIEDIPVSTGRIRLKAGDRLLFYTDGLTEMPLERYGWKISRKRLESMVGEMVAREPGIRLSALMRQLMETVAAVSGQQVAPPGTNTSADDVTLMGVAVEDPSEAAAVVLTPTDTEALCEAIRTLSRRIAAEWTPGLHEAERRVRIVLEEAVLNAWKNGHRQTAGLPISVRWRAGNRYHLEVADVGPGFDPDAVPDPRRLAHRFEATGRGIFMIRMAADDVQWHDHGRRIEARFSRADAAAPVAAPCPGLYDFPLWALSTH